MEDDIYLRYLSFSTAEELQTEMVRRVPHKIDIGAVFNAKPSDHKKIANFQVLKYQIVTLMPCPFTAPKMFCASPNFLCRTKNLFTYCASHKYFVPVQMMICIQ